MPDRDLPWPPGTPCWVDLGVSDVDRSGAFYARLFGWDVADPTTSTGGYALCSLEGRTVAGLGQRVAGGTSLWSTYLAVDDLDAAVLRAARAGWQVLAPPTDVADLGRVAFGADPTGATYGLWQAGTLVGVERHDEPGALTWHELMTRDYPAARAYYQEVHGWQLDGQGADEASPYGAVRGESGAVVCGVGSIDGRSDHRTRSHWMSYFCVEETDRAAAAVVELGGAVTFEPFDSPFGRVAVAAGPDGEVFCLIDTVGGRPLERRDDRTPAAGDVAAGDEVDAPG